MEQWRDIAGYKGYQVSNAGQVRSRLTRKGGLGNSWHLLRQANSHGYLLVSLYQGKRRKKESRKVHHLVLETFIGPRPSPKHETRHMNGIKRDNRLENLCWGTVQENKDDMERLGERDGMKGEGNINSKLTNSDVLRIRELDKCGIHKKEIAKQFDVSLQLVYHIVKRQIWRHI